LFFVRRSVFVGVTFFLRRDDFFAAGESFLSPGYGVIKREPDTPFEVYLGPKSIVLGYRERNEASYTPFFVRAGQADENRCVYTPAGNQNSPARGNRISNNRNLTHPRRRRISESGSSLRRCP